MSWLPNAISLLRMLLVAPTAVLLLRQDYGWALVLMIVAGVSDGLDGYLARRYNWFSRFGAIVDPLADKLLVMVMVTVFAMQDLMPLWLLLIIIGRDLIIVAGGVLYRLLFGPFEMAPSLLSKANTAAQMMALVMIMISLCNFGDLSAFCERVMWPYGLWILAGLGVASGLHYIATWGYRAVVHLRRRERAGIGDAGLRQSRS
ncbi:MAG: CDP-alcohol phosphatidyltransferase family protein [Pseudomonadota bacterium]